MKEKLVLDGVCKQFGSTQVLDHISLSVSEGELVSVLGPSGCGKSTIMNLLTGVLSADAGTIAVDGTVGYMQQKDLLLPWKNCVENVILPDILAGTARDAAIRRAKPYFQTFHLEGFEYSYPHEISGGMRQRVSFLRTFLSSGDILLLDEPFGAVDSITRGNLQQWLIEVSESLNLTILMITHDIEEAILLSDRIYVLSDKPAGIRDELSLEGLTADKKARIFDPGFIEWKRTILEDLMLGQNWHGS